MNRRSILSLFTGAAAAGSVGVRPSDLVRASAATPEKFHPRPELACDAKVDYVLDPLQQWLSPHRSLLEASLTRRKASFHQQVVPAHIASKRSWSPAFKASEAAREYDELQRASRNIWDDDFLLSVLKSKGILP